MFNFRNKLASLSRTEKLFIFFAMLVGFCISAEYGITRPTSQSLFLSAFSASFFPVLWLATVPLNFTIVYLYNQFVSRLGPLRMMAIICSAIAGVNLVCVLFLPIFPQLIFFHACWKDVYILLMFKQLWSMVHATLSDARTKYIFGAIFGIGTCGATLGSLIPGFLAPLLGSTPLFLFTLPIYCVLFFAYYKAYHLSGASLLTDSITPEHASGKEGFMLLARNRYLLGVLFLVMFMQISVALVDYQFSHYLEIQIPQQDLRTAYYGKLIGGVNFISLFMQFFGSFLILKVLGLRKSHFLIPIVLGSLTCGLWGFPTFMVTAAVYGITKSIDYSLFGVLKEMLFVPLSMDEKFRAKAIIDVLGHRTAKALASFLILGLQMIVGTQVFALANYLLFAILIAWFIVVAFLFKKPVPAVAASE